MQHVKVTANDKVGCSFLDAVYKRKEPDKSVNRDKESYQLPHVYNVYDKLFTSGEWKLTTSFRIRQQQF